MERRKERLNHHNVHDKLYKDKVIDTDTEERSQTAHPNTAQHSPHSPLQCMHQGLTRITIISAHLSEIQQCPQQS